jgi:hypothetical protein
MDKISFVGSKGGVGTSTVAVLHALSVAESGRRVRLTATATAGVEDLAVLLAVPTPAPGEVVEVAPGLSLGEAGDPDAYTVVDGGTDTFSDHDGLVYLVVRNDYLALRRALLAPPTTAGVVLVAEAGRSLGRRDVEEVLGVPILAELPVTASVARYIDAGLLVSARRVRLDIATPSGLGTAR